MTVNSEISRSELDTPATISGSGFVAEVLFSRLNQRVQVLGYEGRSLDTMAAALEQGARRRGFSKVFLKAPIHDQAPLEDAGMVGEATINGYYSGQPAAGRATASQSACTAW